MTEDALVEVEDLEKYYFENDTLFEELADDIREGQQVWADKVSEEIVNGTNLFQKAFVDIVFAQHGKLPSPIF